jgi:methyl-accepting chemotaxis protein
MSIKRRIWALPVISAIIFGLGAGASAMIANGALDSITTTASVDYPVLDASKALILDVAAVADGLQDAVAEGDKEKINQVGEQAVKLRARLEKFKKIPGQQDVGTRLGKEFDAYYAPALSAARIMLEMEQGDPQAVVGKMQSALALLNTDLAKVNDAAQRQFATGIEDSKNSVNKVVMSMILTALIVIAVLAVVSWFVVRTIWQQLGGEPEYAREIAQAVAAGDLSTEIRIEAGDKGSLLVALKDMRARLAGLVSEIKQSADTIALASAEIASGNADLAQRTESQAASLDRTTRSMEELTGAVRENATAATQANALVETATSIATRGGQVVGGVVTTMGDINSSAKKIVEIISVIDGIAFQTNILALNAAVEAARAGEQGRGFAVVAAEVRNLAQRSAAAAKEIKTLIGNSVQQVDAGAQLVSQAGNTMDEVVASVQRVTGILREISLASTEQTTGISQINEAIIQMDDVTQQNAALVEQAAAAAQSMREQASHLSEVVGVFVLDEAPRVPSAPRLGNGKRTRLALPA